MTKARLGILLILCLFIMVLSGGLGWAQQCVEGGLDCPPQVARLNCAVLGSGVPAGEAEPTTWGPTNIQADADDGYNSDGTWNLSDASVALYVSGSSYNENGGLSWELPAIPANATIQKMYIRLRSNDSQDGTLSFTIQTEDVDPASQTIWSQAHLPSSSNTFINSQTTQSEAFASNTWYFGESDTHPINLNDDLQDLITKYGAINLGDRINIAIIQRSEEVVYTGFYDSANEEFMAQLTIVWIIE